MSDPVDHPAHYNRHPSGVECITVIEWMPFNLGNVIKYVWRAGEKSEDPIQDLRKAAWYLDREIARLEGNDARSTPGPGAEEPPPEQEPGWRGPAPTLGGTGPVTINIDRPPHGAPMAWHPAFRQRPRAYDPE